MPSSWTPDAAYQPIDQGYRVKSPNRPPDNNGRRANGANGFLENANGQRVGLWVNEITADFELAGSLAQSAMQRDFYPHNFTQPKLSIGGQTTNNYEYNRLADFVRQSQLDALDMATNGFILKFVCVQPDDVRQPVRETMRGRHQHISIDGFVATIKKGGTRFVTAHTYQFDFVVLAAHSFLPGLVDWIIGPYLTDKTIAQRMEAGMKPVVQKKPSKAPTPVKPKPGATGDAGNGTGPLAPPPPDNPRPTIKSVPDNTADLMPTWIPTLP